MQTFLPGQGPRTIECDGEQHLIRVRCCSGWMCGCYGRLVEDTEPCTCNGSAADALA